MNLVCRKMGIEKCLGYAPERELALPAKYGRRNIPHDEFFLDNIRSYNSIVRRLPFLVGGLFHATSPANYDKIMKSGEIRPYQEGSSSCLMAAGTIDGRHRTWSRHKDFVSVLDLYTPNQDEIILTANRWPAMIDDQSPYCMLLAFRVKDILPKLITFHTADIDLRFMHIPYVESFYPESIPLAFVEQTFEIPTSPRGTK